MDKFSAILRTNKSKIATGVFLFCYFGFIAIPELTRPYFSLQIALWVLVLPVILIILVASGIGGGIGLWREKTRRATPDPRNKFYIWVACLSILWFLVSISIANTTYYAYFHKKFDSETWKNASWNDGGVFQISQRERMLDDFVTNVIPGRSSKDVIELLGEPDNLCEEDEGYKCLIYYYKSGIVDPVCLVIVIDDKGFVKNHFTSECG